METDEKIKKQGLSLDWLVGGALTRIGETLDRVTGRGWNPSSSLATSKLTEKLCFLLDEEAKPGENGGMFAPHIIALKMQWNKFSSDSNEELDILRDELHAAAIDHINDKRYHTFAPIEIEIKTDYFTEGVRIIGGFGKFGDEEEEASINVTVPNITIEQTGEGSRASINLDTEVLSPPESSFVCTLKFSVNGKLVERVLDFSKTKRFTVGRGTETGVAIDHETVSKVHAAIVLNSEGRVLVADTGSTNGTYVDEKRIAYGKTAEISEGTKLKFGSVVVDFEMPESENSEVGFNDEPVPETNKDFKPAATFETREDVKTTDPVEDPAELKRSEAESDTVIE